jgi:gluconokinase
MVIIVMGVSGSGKTTIGRTLAERLGWPFADADDWHPVANIEKMRSGKPLTDEDREPWIHSVNGAIRSWIRDGRNAVLACSALRSSYRQTLRSCILDGAFVRFVFLKGTYEEIDRRLRLRTGHFMPEALLKSQFATLEEPDASEALIVDVHLQVAHSVAHIIAALHLDTTFDETRGLTSGGRR